MTKHNGRLPADHPRTRRGRLILARMKGIQSRRAPGQHNKGEAFRRRAVTSSNHHFISMILIPNPAKDDRFGSERRNIFDHLPSGCKCAG